MAPNKTKRRARIARATAADGPTGEREIWDQMGAYASMMLGDMAGEYIAATMPPERREPALRAAEYHQATISARGADQ